MNPELVKWLIHQPALFVGGFVFGVYCALKFPGLVTSENLLALASATLTALGAKASFEQTGPLQTWIEAPRQPESKP